MKGLTKSVIAGQHHLINALLGASSATRIYLEQILFDYEPETFQGLLLFRDSLQGHEMHPETRLLDEQTYVTREGRTALYDSILFGMATLARFLARCEELDKPAIAHMAIFTDARTEGEDECSKMIKPESLKRVVEYVLENGVIDRITLVGIGKHDYRAVAKSIGIQQVIEADASEKEIREAFNMISSQFIA